MIENNDNLKSVGFLAKAARALPTSSAPIEQSFSVMNLLRTDQRSQMSEASLESLVLIHDEYHGKTDINIPNGMIGIFDQVKSSLNGRKSKVGKERRLQRIVGQDKDFKDVEGDLPSQDQTSTERAEILHLNTQ